jgi:hypothetical protein
MDDGTLHIQSFRQCFQLERRIHRLDKWRLPMPYGLPVRGIVYCVALLVGVLVLSRLPLLGAFVTSMHPAVRFVVIPVAGAYALMTLRIDGRAAHMVGVSYLRHRCEPQRLVAFRAAPRRDVVALGTITLAPDERSPRLRAGVIEGEGRVVLRYPVELKQRSRKRLDVRQTGAQARWRGTQIDLDLGQRICVR